MKSLRLGFTALLLLLGATCLPGANFKSECIEKTCTAAQVAGFYKQYAAELTGGPLARATILWGFLTGEMTLVDRLLVTFLAQGYVVNVEDFANFDHMVAYNTHNAWLLSGERIMVTTSAPGPLKMSTEKRRGLVIMLGLGERPVEKSPIWRELVLGTGVYADVFSGIVPTRLFSSGMLSRPITRIAIRPNVTVSRVLESDVVPGGSAEPVGYRATVTLGSAVIDSPRSMDATRPCSADRTQPSQYCSPWRKNRCPGQYADQVLPVVRSNAGSTVPPWSVAFPAELVVNAAYFSNCCDFYTYNCVNAAGLWIDRGKEHHPPQSTDNDDHRMDALLLFDTPKGMSNPGAEYARIVANAALPRQLNKVRTAVAGHLAMANSQLIKPCKDCHEPDQPEPRTAVGYLPPGFPTGCIPDAGNGAPSLVIVVLQRGSAPTATSKKWGITVEAMTLWMRDKLCTPDVLMLDGGGSSQFYWSNPNGGEWVSPPGDDKGYRPVPTILRINPRQTGYGNGYANPVPVVLKAG